MGQVLNQELKGLAFMTSAKVFVREATGLVREFNWFDGMIMGLGYANLAVGAFIIFGWGSWLFPGSNMMISIGLVGFLIDIPIVLAYSMFGASLPRSGGDYVYVSRSLRAGMGFATGLVFFIYLSIFSVGQNGWFITTTVLAPTLAAIGSISNNAGLLALSQTIVQPGPSIAIGVLTLIVTFLLLLVRSSTLHKVLLGLFVIAFLGYPILYCGVLALNTNASFVAAFNAYTQQAGLNTSYTGIISSAKDAGAAIVPPSFSASLLALPIIYATIAFPQSATYIGGETKHASRQLPMALIIGLLVIVASYTIMGFFTYNVFGFDFISATAFYGFSGASGYPLPAAPFTDYFLAILFPNMAFNWFMLITGVAWEFILMIAFALMATRFIFAVAFDRVIPSALADVSERFHTPIKANALAMLGAFIFLVLTAFNFLGTYVNSIVAWTSAYLVVMIGAIVYPYTSKTMFEQSPPFVKKRVAGIPAMSILGFLGAIALVVVLYTLIVQPAVSGASVQGLAIVIATYVIGFILYYAAKMYRKGKGIDLDLVFKEIPPE
jgi:APA family basic amino acid/polyamine antiporter